MPIVSPVIELIKAPKPVPSVVLVLITVGLAVVLQHMPRAVNVEPPISETLPPPIDVVALIEEISVVVIVGRFVVKLISFP